MSETKASTTTDKDLIEPRNGLVAFYDILGYSSIAQAGIDVNIKEILKY